MEDIQSEKDKIRKYITSGNDINSLNERGYNFLHDAVKYSLELTKFLVEEYHANINCKTHEKEETPLSISIIRGQEKTMEYLLDKGANIDSTDINGKTPLHIAFEDSHYDAVKILLERGANFTIKDKRGNSIRDYVESGTLTFC